MFLFAIVFGLSMDYEVFLLSRIKEEYYLAALMLSTRLGFERPCFDAVRFAFARCLSVNDLRRLFGFLRSQIFFVPAFFLSVLSTFFLSVLPFLAPFFRLFVRRVGRRFGLLVVRQGQRLPVRRSCLIGSWPQFMSDARHLVSMTSPSGRCAECRAT